MVSQQQTVGGAEGSDWCALLGFSAVAHVFWCTSVAFKFSIGVLGLLVNLVFMC